VFIVNLEQYVALRVDIGYLTTGCRHTKICLPPINDAMAIAEKMSIAA